MPNCPKRARVFPPDTDVPCGPDVSCGLPDDGHEQHVGSTGFMVGDPPVAQTVAWYDDDRRTFVGEFTPCDRLDDRSRGGPCTLPGGHRGNCAP